MLAKTILGVIGLTLSSASLAAVQTWNFVSGNGAFIENGDEHGIGNGSYLDMTVGGIEVVVSAWSSTGNTGSCSTNECIGANGVPIDNDPFIERADLTQYSGGLGATNADEVDDVPNHALDNTGSSDGWQDYDMVLMQFDTAVKLEEVDIGWYDTDSDISVLAYTDPGAINGVPFGSGTSWGELLNQGWSFSQNYSDIANNAGSSQIISNPVESRYWLVGVYNPVFGNNWSNTNDAIKLYGITTTTSNGGGNPPPPQIPEPMTALLFAAGLFGLYRQQRKH